MSVYLLRLIVQKSLFVCKDSAKLSKDSANRTQKEMCFLFILLRCSLFYVSSFLILSLLPNGSYHKPTMHQQGGEQTVVVSHDVETFPKGSSVVAGSHSLIQIVDEGEMGVK